MFGQNVRLRPIADIGLFSNGAAVHQLLAHILTLQLMLSACATNSIRTREAASVYELTGAGHTLPKRMIFDERRVTLRRIFDKQHSDASSGLYDRVEHELIFAPYIFLLFPAAGLGAPANWEWRGVQCSSFSRTGETYVACPKGTSYVYRPGVGVVSFTYGNEHAEYVLVGSTGILRSIPGISN